MYIFVPSGQLNAGTAEGRREGRLDAAILNGKMTGQRCDVPMPFCVVAGSASVVLFSSP